MMPWSALLSRIKKRRPEAQTSADALPADAVFTFLLDQVTNEDLFRGPIEAYRKAKRLPLDERERAYIPIYFMVEEAIATNKPPIVKQQYTSQSLREKIRSHVSI